MEPRSFEGKKDENADISSFAIGVRICDSSHRHHRDDLMSSAATPSSSSSLNLSALAEPAARQIDGAAMDYFLIELVHTIRLSSAVATARAKKVEHEMAEAGLIPPSSAHQDVSSRALNGKAKDIDEDEECVRSRLEAIGLHVGANFTERYFP